VKTTIELDEQKLKRVMQLTGIKTRKEAIDFALTEAERIAALDSYYQKDFYIDDASLVVDPDYDVLAKRNDDQSRLS
jgi:Arc/MetJ family transcription regulator